MKANTNTNQQGVATVKKSKIDLKKVNEYGVFLVLIAIFILFSIYAPNFFQIKNMFNVARQISTLGIVAVGMTIVMISGGIDLSVGYQISLINVLCAWLMVNANISPLLASIIVIALGTFIGFINGLIVVKTGVVPLIVTLAIMNVLRGISFMISRGLPIFGFPKSFSFLGQGSIAGIPVSLIIMAVIFVIGSIILKKTYFGRYFYAIGSNEEAAKLSGINTGALQMLAFSICGFLTSVAAVLTLSRTNSGLSSNGVGFEFNVITACVLGGVSASGGKGTIFGALVGVLIVGFLDNGLLLMNVSEYTQWVVKGVLMLAAVVYDITMRRKNEYIKKIKAINVENV
ncbi:MAG TPA: ABC transporter permease [Clostridiaceae bacterium]|nr:ABC transporter permease [Clostridiaceae bacterium]